MYEDFVEKHKLGKFLANFPMTNVEEGFNSQIIF